ncbi:DUF5666 domain-containing protein [Chloroflexota bacterium]
MSKQTDILQESLEKLEAGEALESAQGSLPGEEQASLSLVSRLRAAAWPRRDPQTAGKQRGQIIALYHQEAVSESKEQPRWNLFNDWRMPAAVSAVVVILMVCGLVTMISIGAFWLSEGQQVSLDPLPKNEFDKQAAGDETPGLAAESLEAVVEPAAPLDPYEQLASHEAFLGNLHGLVEIRVDEAWEIVSEDIVLTAGAALRTGSFSSAHLTFKDGSLARIGPNSELSIVKLAVDLDSDTRQITLMQSSGESSHAVVPLENATGGYQLDTLSAQGRVKGTQFHVRVMPEQTAWIVDSGAVEVSAAGTAVQVGAGQMTSVSTDEQPDDPVEFISGQGEVTAISGDWVIGGQSYQTHVQTIIIGNPQVGDLVFYEAHLEDAIQVVDLIVLVRRNPANTFTLTGVVEIISDTLWKVSGKEVTIPPDVDKDGITDGGVLVRIKGVILTDEDGVTFQAEEIRLLPDDNDAPFEFSGVVQIIGAQSWQISDITVVVDKDTVRDQDLKVSEAVHVKGWILDDGTWLASSIVRSHDQNDAFEFVGYIETIDPWRVAGIPITTQTWTTIDPGLIVGDLVLVSGQIQTDGSWLAFEIRRYDGALLSILVGRVYSKDPWVVSGLELNVVEGETIIVGDIEVGMLVRVEMQLLPDGTHTVIRIEPFEGFDWELACQSVVVTVTSIDGDRIVLEGFPAIPLGGETRVEGDIKPGSLVKTMICYDEDMNVKLVYIIVLEDPELAPLPPPDDDDDYDDDKGKKVTICHNIDHNPHTIVISQSAWPAHQAHGDTMGPCP